MFSPHLWFGKKRYDKWRDMIIQNNCLLIILYWNRIYIVARRVNEEENGTVAEWASQTTAELESEPHPICLENCWGSSSSKRSCACLQSWYSSPILKNDVILVSSGNKEIDNATMDWLKKFPNCWSWEAFRRCKEGLPSQQLESIDWFVVFFACRATVWKLLRIYP